MRAAPGCLREGIVEAVAVALRVVGLERGVVPVAVEGGLELLDEGGRRDGREAHVPLDAVQQGRAREVARTDVGRVETGVASEQPRLGVETSAQRVVLDAGLRPELLDETVECGSLGGSHVGRGDDAERHSTIAEIAKLALDHSDPVPLDERHDDVDPIRGRDLRSQLVSDAGFA